MLNPAGVNRLVLKDFRNYRSLEVMMDNRSVALTGLNGAGKTNILESLSFLSPGRGLRGVNLNEVCHKPTDEPIEQGHALSSWSVYVELDHPEGALHIGTGLESVQGRDKRVVKVNGSYVTKQSALTSLCRVVWVTPAMDRLFVESSSSRRRFLDRLVFGIYPEHADHVARFEKFVRERTKILSLSNDEQWLDRVEAELASSSFMVSCTRKKFLEQLMDIQRTLSPIFPFAMATMSLNNASQKQPPLVEPSELQEILRSSRKRDALMNRCSVGAHKEDLSVVYERKKSAADQCSTGEQKALLLSLILATVKLVSSAQKGVPLLLLDEVIAHLDEERRMQLFETLLSMNIQTWMTGTDAEIFAKWREKIQHLFVKNGIVQQL